MYCKKKTDKPVTYPFLLFVFMQKLIAALEGQRFTLN